MLILIEDTERGMDVAKGIWGAFSSCLYIKEEDIDYTQLINKCEQCNVSLILVTQNMEYFKKENPHAFCIECDGNGFGISANFLRFKEDYHRDMVVKTIIENFKRMKLL